MTKGRPTGTLIEGWWCWWPNSGGTYARRFSSEEDARGYIPTIKGKYSTGPPFGVKCIARVVYDYSRNDWSRDALITIPENEVQQQWVEQQEVIVNAEQEVQGHRSEQLDAA